MDSTTAKPTLGYWKIRGLVTPIRYILNQAKVDFENVDYVLGDAPTFNSEPWTSVKFTLGLDFPNLPYFVDGEVKLTESLAIMRYIMNKWAPELAGKTTEDKAIADMLVGVIGDLKSQTSSHCYGSGDKEAAVKNAEAKLEPIVKFLGAKHFIVGDYATFVDFFFFELLELLDFISEGSLNKQYPTLAAYHSRVEELLKDSLPLERTLTFNNKVAKINNTV